MRRTYPLHGNAGRYRKGCRCTLCSESQAKYIKAWRLKRKRRMKRRLTVISVKALRHMDELRKYGVGVKSIAAACDVGTDTLNRIRAGQKWIYARTERKILSVTAEAVSDGSRVDASLAQNLLRELMEKGYKPIQLSRALGRTDGSLPMLHRKKIWARTQLRVEKLYRRAMGGGLAA